MGEGRVRLKDCTTAPTLPLAQIIRDESVTLRVMPSDTAAGDLLTAAERGVKEASDAAKAARSKLEAATRLMQSKSDAEIKIGHMIVVRTS